MGITVLFNEFARNELARHVAPRPRPVLSST
jgi:hypothetical protein